MGRGFGRQVGAQPDGDFALDAQVDEVGGRQGHGRAVHGGGEDGAGAGMVEARELLHHGRGERDFVAGDGAAPPGDQERLQGLLHGVGLVQVAGVDILGRMGKWRPVLAGIEQEPRGLLDSLLGRHHRSNIAAAPTPINRHGGREPVGIP